MLGPEELESGVREPSWQGHVGSWLHPFVPGLERYCPPRNSVAAALVWYRKITDELAKLDSSRAMVPIEVFL
jgi:hypothetical protein